VTPGSAGRVFTRFAELIDRQSRSASPSDDGRIELKVVARSADEPTTVVVHGATLGEHKGINAPGVTLPTSALTPKDIDDLLSSV
jgi:pyruvate kinase